MTIIFGLFFEVIMNHFDQYLKLLEVLEYLRANKTGREVAVLVTELEKVVAYYKIFVIDASNQCRQ